MLKITSDNLPSCCYYTLLNGYLEINCLDKLNEHIYEQMMSNDDNKDDTNTHHDTDILYNQHLLCDHTGPIYKDCIIRLWSLLTWTCLITFRGHIQPVFDVQFGPFGHYFASCSLDKTARL
ncbi:unnamed protein product [Rotaria sordida]|uniref:Uncharacterized protein n=1 Tax=Rotaria sordida TaxID=392033 RepID=A0A815K220_9BILA|nr:unnamed protein product [Rotaria sordida]CAF1470507.1 unnamed protein product [Rotaria sordida]CAF3988215.1 unnamed protein product [Rotaria sordida]CAF4069436.1 unnamed protein product [Rotaria sordida]